MRKDYFRKIAGAAIMTGSMILGAASLSSVQAQYPYQDPYYRQQQDPYYRQQQDQYRRAQQDRWRRDRYGRRGGTYDSYPNWGGYEFRQTALNAGYNEGLKAGRQDRNRRWGRGGDFSNSSAYRNADRDYNSRFRDRELYARYFRMAFETGYNDGLNGN